MENIYKLIEHLMDEYGDYLKQTAFMMTSDRTLSEDLTQETFISFYKYYGKFNHKSSYKTYLYRILMNHIKMYFRKNKEMQLYSDFTEDIIDKTIHFENQLVNSLDLYSAINQLKEIYRNVIVLYYYDDLPIDQVGYILNISKSNVKMRLKRGKQQIGEILGKGI